MQGGRSEWPRPRTEDDGRRYRRSLTVIRIPMPATKSTLVIVSSVGYGYVGCLLRMSCVVMLRG